MNGKAWFDIAFGPWYESLYPHRSLAEADLIWKSLGRVLPAEGCLLDIGCGTGRHMRVLGEAGYAVTGLDRSETLLRRAAEHPAGLLVRGDMRRLPFGDAAFDGVLSMFTSFGYFATRAEHEALLREWRRVLAPGGRLILDYLNAEAVRRNLNPESERHADGLRIHETRAIRSREEGEAVTKKVEIFKQGKAVAEYVEEVALYAPETVTAMGARAGFAEVERLGDYRGAPLEPASPRAIFVWTR